MSLKDHLPKSVADAIFEEEPPKIPIASQPASHYVMPPNGIGVPIKVPVIDVPPVADNPLLTQLRSRTNFESTPLGQQLQSVINDLGDTGLSETQKTRTALKLSHIPAQNVIDTLTGLQAVLAADKTKFDAQMESATTSEVAGRQQKMATIDAQIHDLEAQLNTLRGTKATLATEIDSKTRQIQSLKDNYRAAFDIRTQEIATQISHYQTILQG